MYIVWTLRIEKALDAVMIFIRGTKFYLGLWSAAILSILAEQVSQPDNIQVGLL